MSAIAQLSCPLTGPVTTGDAGIPLAEAPRFQ
jgi:hypothetical protein